MTPGSSSGFHPDLEIRPEFHVPDGIRILSLDDVKEYTDGFHEDNFLGETESSVSRVYVGTIVESDEDVARDVIVETWERKLYFFRDVWETQIRLLTEPAICSHPNVAKLYGYFESEELLGLVYDCRALDTLRAMIDDESFTWKMRIKAALRVARVLNLLHSQSPPFLVRNLEPGSILLGLQSGSVWLRRGHWWISW